MESISFKIVTAEDIRVLQKITQNFLPYSDFNPISMICWNANQDNAYAIHNGNLIIKIKDYLRDKYNYSVLGENNVDETLNALNQFTNSFEFVPETTVKEIKDLNNLTITESRDNFDYVVTIADFVELKGGNYKNMRRHLNAFRDSNKDVDVIELDFSSKRNCDLVMELTEKWTQEKHFDDDKTLEDLNSVKTYIQNSKSFNDFSVGIFVKGHLVAFTLNELLPDGWAMGHFGKSSYDFENSALTAEYNTSKLLFKKGYKFLNMQQDTGIEGLREAKTNLHPSGFLKKFSIFCKPK